MENLVDQKKIRIRMEEIVAGVIVLTSMGVMLAAAMGTTLVLMVKFRDRKDRK